LELELKIVKPVVSVSVKKESESGCGPLEHASVEVPPGPVIVDVLSGFEQAVTAQIVKIHGRRSVEKRCETGVIGPPFHDIRCILGWSGIVRCVRQDPQS
jgi:hypothetical protein